MKQNQFIHWLKGFADRAEEMPTEEQWNIIKENLELVDNEVDIQYLFQTNKDRFWENYFIGALNSPTGLKVT